MATVTVSSSGHVTTTGLSSFATIGSTGTGKRNWNGSIVVTFTAQPIVTLGSSVSPLVPVVSPASFAIPQNPSLDSLIGHLSVSNIPLSAMNIVSGDPNHLFAVYPTNQNLKTSPTITPVPNAVYNLGVTATNAGGTSSPASVQVAVGILPGPFTTQNGDFTIGWDAVPTLAAEDVVVGLCFAKPAAFSDIACVTRFSLSGNIEVRNGGTYSSDVTLPYTASTSYHFRLVVRLSNHTYDVFVTPQGQSEVLLANNYAFRTEQANVASLSYLGRIDSTGDATLSNLVGPSPITPTAPVVASRSFNLSIPASAGTVVGTMTATGSPTSWAITAGNSAGNFAIDNAGVITVTAAGATGITAGTYSLTCTATNAVGSGSGNAAVTASVASGLADGFSGAPFGSPNYPTVLNGMAARPSWHVAGVDYHVGYPTNIALKSTATIATDVPGTSLNNGQVTVSGSNVIVDGYNITGGVLVRGNNCTIRNCNITGAVESLPGDTGVDNLLLHACTITGAPGGPYTVNWNFKTLTIEYCNFVSCDGDHIDLSGNSQGGQTNARYIVRYSYFKDTHLVGQHGDMVQTFTGGTCALWQIIFNTSDPSQGSTQGFMYEPDGSTPGDGIKLTGTGEVGWNSFRGPVNFYCSATLLDVLNAAGKFTVHDNYFDSASCLSLSRGGQAAPGDGAASTVFTANIDFRTGLPASND